MTSPSKEPKRLLYEVWLRVQCPDKECKHWTFIPSKGRPQVMLCVVCARQIRVAELEKQGKEWGRRADNGLKEKDHG